MIEICPVFEGKGYVEWRQRLKILLAREGFKSPLRDSEDARKYVKLTETNRELKMSDYDDKQDKGRCFILERLDSNHIMSNRRSITNSQTND